MAGIDHIQAEILQEARTTADALLESARADAGQLAEETAGEVEAVRRAADEDCARIREAGQVRLASRQEMLRRQERLRRKQELVTGLIDEAYRRLVEEDPDAYWKRILLFLDAHIHPGEGRICFSKRDLNRMPAAVRQAIETRAEAAGAKLAIESNASVTDGFILDFGGINENCTLKAIFAERYDKMQDAVTRILWQE